MILMPALRRDGATGPRTVVKKSIMLCRLFHQHYPSKTRAVRLPPRRRRPQQPHQRLPTECGPMLGSPLPTPRVVSSTRLGCPSTSSSSSIQWGGSGNHYVGVRWHGGGAGPDHDAPTVTVSFVLPDNSVVSVPARIGESLLQTAHRNDIDLEGACEGVCACSTCHLIFPAELYDALPDPSEDEEDMLDMAFGLTETSRLGCQITVTAEMDGAVLELPKATRNFYVDGHVPKPH